MKQKQDFLLYIVAIVAIVGIVIMVWYSNNRYIEMRDRVGRAIITEYPYENTAPEDNLPIYVIPEDESTLPLENKGFIRADPQYPHSFKFDNGERFFPFGDTAYYLLGEEESTIREYIDSRASKRFNFIRFSAIGIYDNVQVPGFWPFDGTPGNTNWIVNEKKMQKLDWVFDYAASKNVNIELIMWGYSLEGGNGMWGDDDLENMWVDYLVNRYKSRTNLLMWTVTNEFERYPSHDDNYTFEWSDVDGMNRIVSRIKSIDDVHIVGVHAGAATGIDGWGPLTVSHLWSDSEVNAYNVFLRSGHWNATWMYQCPYAASHNIQEWGVLYVPTLWKGELMIPQWEDDEGWIIEPLNIEDGIAVDWNEQPPRPYINTEFGYQYEEGLPNNHPNMVSCQLFSQDTVRKSAWLTAASGGYLAAGFVHTVKDIDENNIETFRPEQLQYLYGFFAKRTEYWKMAPHHEWVHDKNALLALPGIEYVAYFPRGMSRDNYIYLHNGKYSVEWLNPRTGAYTKDRIIIDVGTGNTNFTPPYDLDSDWVLHLKSERRVIQNRAIVENILIEDDGTISP